MITRELVELKHKVLSERIDRLYNIFVVISQEEKHISKLNAIKVIKEQYEKMYGAILEKEAFDKYVFEGGMAGSYVSNLTSYRNIASRLNENNMNYKELEIYQLVEKQQINYTN